MCGQDGQKAGGLIRELFSVEGRVTRTEFLKALVILFCIGLAYVLIAGMLMSMLMMHTGLEGYVAARAIRNFVLYVPVVTPLLCALIKRLHDINLPGLVAALVLVPYLRLALIIFLIFMPGKSEDNGYGPFRIYNWHIDT